MFLRNDALDRVCSDDEWSDARTSAWRIAVCQNARGARTIVSGDTVGRVRWTDTAGALEHEQACSAGAAPCVGVVKTRREFRILCGGRGRDVSIFDGSSGEATCTLTHDENVTCLAVGAVDCADLEKETEDGLLVLTGSDDGNARLWSLHHYFVLRTFEGHTLAVSAVCFSDGGRTVLSASLDRSVRTWDANSAQCLFMFESTSAPLSLSFGEVRPGVTAALVCGRDGAALWDTCKPTAAKLHTVVRGARVHVGAFAKSCGGLRVFMTAARDAVDFWRIVRSESVASGEVVERIASFSASGTINDAYLTRDPLVFTPDAEAFLTAEPADGHAASAPLSVSVSLTVLCASIAAAESESKPNAYVVATLNAGEAIRELGKTPVVRDSVEPVWREPSSATFKLQVPLSEETFDVVLAMYDHRALRKKHDCLGRVTLSREVLLQKRSKPIWVPAKLRGEENGTLLAIETEMGVFPRLGLEFVVACANGAVDHIFMYALPSPEAPPPEAPEPDAPRVLATVTALHAFRAEHPGDLGFEYRDEIEVHRRDGDWWHGRRIADGAEGTFPATYVDATLKWRECKAEEEDAAR